MGMAALKLAGVVNKSGRGCKFFHAQTLRHEILDTHPPVPTLKSLALYCPKNLAQSYSTLTQFF